MTFFIPDQQALSLYAGAIIRLNYLYDKEVMHLKTYHKDNLLWVFHLITVEDSDFVPIKKDGKLVYIPMLIHVSWTFTFKEEGYYTLRLYQFESSDAMLFLETDDVIKERLKEAMLHYEEDIDNKFFLLLKIRKLSTTTAIGSCDVRTLNLGIKGFLEYNNSTLVRLDKGCTNILKYLKSKIRENPYEGKDYINDLFKEGLNINLEVVRLRYWKIVWEFYTHQKDRWIWHEMYLWMKQALEKYQRSYVQSLLVQTLLGCKQNSE